MRTLLQKLTKVTAFTLFGSLSSTLVSCALLKGKDKEDTKEKPIEQPITQAPPTAPKHTADPTAMFRTPDDDHLPTDEQLKQGAESSIGTGVQSVKNPPERPSTTVKPPAPPEPQEDQLDPGE